MNFSGITRDSRLGRLLRQPLALLPPQMVVPILQGKLRGKRWIVGSGTHGCWLGSYEYSKQQLFRQVVAQNSVVYDVGANVGFYTLLASELVGEKGQVVAFEPVPRNLHYLKRHLSLNQINNVQVLETAVSDETGLATFSLGINPAEGTFSLQGDLQVQTVSIDDLIFTQGLPAPNYMKIDVEGAEEKVLVGAAKVIKKCHPTIFLATHGEVVHQTCLQILLACGYTLTPVDANSLEETDEILATYSE